MVNSKKRVGEEVTLVPKADEPQPELDAYSVEGFCRRHSTSRSHYYNMRLLGDGPKESHSGGRVLITKESAEAWRKKITED